MIINYKGMTTAELHQELKNAIAHTADGLRRMAGALAELRSRGEDVARYNSPFLDFMPMISSGRLMPEMLLIYGGKSPTFMAHIATLIPEEQTKLLMGDGYIDFIDDKGGAPRKVMLARLSLPQLRQVIGDGVVRTPGQQRNHIVPKRLIRRVPEAHSSDVAEPRPEDFATAEQWSFICGAAEETGVHPYQQMMLWLVKTRCVPAAPRTRKRGSAAVARENEALRWAMGAKP